MEESCQEMDINPLDYWKVNYINYPTLAEYANKLLSTPATSAPVERLLFLGLKDVPSKMTLLKTYDD